MSHRKSHSPGHIRRRVSPDGRESWQAIVSYRVDGRRRTLSGTRRTRHEAQKLLAELLVEAAKLDSPKSPRIETVGELLDLFEARRASRWQPSTRRQWVSVRRCHYDPKWADRKLRSIDTLEVEDWLEDLRSGEASARAPLSVATVRRILNPLASAFAFAVARRIVDFNPFDGAELPAGERGPDPVAYLDVDAAVRVLAALRDVPVAGVAAQLAADTGLRRSEVCGLRFADIDFDKGVLHVRRRALLGEADKVVVARGTKTGSERFVRLAGATVAMLREHRRWAMDHAGRVGVVWTNDLFVFPTNFEPELPLRPDVLSAIWRKKCREVDVTMRFHDLRHLHATLLMSAGWDIATVAKRLGHSGLGRTTLGTYSHRLADVEIEAANDAARRLREGSKSEDDDSEDEIGGEVDNEN